MGLLVCACVQMQAESNLKDESSNEVQTWKGWFPSSAAPLPCTLSCLYKLCVLIIKLLISVETKEVSDCVRLTG